MFKERVEDVERVKHELEMLKMNIEDSVKAINIKVEQQKRERL